LDRTSGASPSPQSDIWETPVEESSVARHLWAMDQQNPPTRTLTDAAKRALAEAEERRRLATEETRQQQGSGTKERGGRKGPDPVRYGDWEKDGIISDF
jgi:hypothetical protein